jgi:hypothetical protein
MRETKPRSILHHASCIMHRTGSLVLLLGLALTAAPGFAAEMTAPAEVAPQAQGTRSQTWASAAWSAGAKCWLVAWREGFLNEPVSDIWCARVSADGKALDPAGIRLTKGQGLKDRPRVASDGKGFLVVWEDLSNGKDWDVRGARVSGEGKVLDAEGFLVAGGDPASPASSAAAGHNQARPDVAFAKGNYFAVWQGFVDDGYGVYGARISPDGKVLDAQPAEIIGFPKRPRIQGILPSVASNGSDLLVFAHAHNFTYMPGFPCRAGRARGGLSGGLLRGPRDRRHQAAGARGEVAVLPKATSAPRSSRRSGGPSCRRRSSGSCGRG